MRYDAKARYLCNLFTRYYARNFICERCMAHKPTRKPDEAVLNYTDFRAECPRYQTCISDATYRRTASPLSPWACIEGWHLHTRFHDLMHTLYLGLCRDLVAYLLADMSDCGALGDGSLRDQLRRISLDMMKTFRDQGKLGYLRI